MGRPQLPTLPKSTCATMVFGLVRYCTIRVHSGEVSTAMTCSRCSCRSAKTVDCPIPISAYTVALDSSVLKSVSSPSNRMGFCRSSSTFWIFGSTVVDVAVFAVVAVFADVEVVAVVEVVDVAVSIGILSVGIVQVFGYG